MCRGWFEITLKHFTLLPNPYNANQRQIRKPSQFIIFSLSALTTERILEIKVNTLSSQGQPSAHLPAETSNMNLQENPHLLWAKLCKLRSTIKIWWGISDGLNNIYIYTLRVFNVVRCWNTVFWNYYFLKLSGLTQRSSCSLDFAAQMYLPRYLYRSQGQNHPSPYALILNTVQ